MKVLVVGDPFEGLRVYGPYGDTDSAAEYARDAYKNETWWVVDLCEIVEVTLKFGCARCEADGMSAL